MLACSASLDLVLTPVLVPSYHFRCMQRESRRPSPLLYSTRLSSCHPSIPLYTYIIVCSLFFVEYSRFFFFLVDSLFYFCFFFLAFMPSLYFPSLSLFLPQTPYLHLSLYFFLIPFLFSFTSPSSVLLDFCVCLLRVS